MTSDDGSKDANDPKLAQLAPGERELLKKRFGIDICEDATLAEVAKQFDLTREKIREIERRAQKK